MENKFLRRKNYMLFSIISVFFSLSCTIQNNIPEPVATISPSPKHEGLTTPSPPVVEGSIINNTTKVDITPETPCIGQSVTIKGNNFNQEVKSDPNVVIWLQPSNPLPTSIPIPEGIEARCCGKNNGSQITDPNTIKLGTSQINQQGDFTFSFELKNIMGPSRNGDNISIEADHGYFVYIQNTSSTSIFSFKTCN